MVNTYSLGVVVTDEGAQIEVPDYGDDARPPQNAVDDAFAKLEQLVIDADNADARVAELTAALAAAQAAQKQILERDIPDLMTSMKLDDFSRNGLKIKLKRDIRASLPSAKDRPVDRAQAIKWLIDNGHGALVKNYIGIELERGLDERADELVALLKKQGVDPKAEKDVHASTLSKLVRELYEGGHTVPTKLLNVFDHKVASITRKK